MASHASRQLSAHDRSTLVDPNVVLATTESVLNDTLHLEKIALAHEIRFVKSKDLLPRRIEQLLDPEGVAEPLGRRGS